MIIEIIESVRDRYLSWRTGHNKQERDWIKWRDENIVTNAITIENMFMNFQYILPVSIDIFNHNDPFCWSPCTEFNQYLYPQRPLGQNAVWYFARGFRDTWDGRFHICGLRAEQDQVFVATNSQEDAIMIALKWS